MFGGWDGGNFFNSVERFDPRDGNKCVQLKEMKEGQYRATAAEYNGRIYVTGKNGWKEDNTVEMFAFFN